MKNSLVILLSIFTLTACMNQKRENLDTETTITENPVGGEKDAHGCLPSAGETWSRLKEDCIRIFDIGQRLNPVQTEADEAVISAFILFDEDKTQAELFVPKTENSILLKTSDKEVYENGEYKFDAAGSSLYINGIKAYQAEFPE